MAFRPCLPLCAALDCLFKDEYTAQESSQVPLSALYKATMKAVS